MQAAAVAGGWSVDELDEEIRLRYGRRRQGGVSGSVEPRGILDQLDVLGEGWRRWHESLLRKDETSDRRPLDGLPEEVRAAVGRADRVIAHLRRAVAAAVVRMPAAAT